MNRVGKVFALGLTLAAGAALAGPADNSLVIGASQEPRVLGGDFLNVISNQSIKIEIENYLFAPLMVQNLRAENEAVLVTEVPTLANRRLRVTDIGGGKRRLEIDLTLKPNLRWSDGAPLTTDDFAFYFEVGKAKGMPVPNPDYWERVNLRVRDRQNMTVIFEPAYYYDTYGSPIGYAPAHIMRPEWEKVKAAAANLNPDRDAQRLNELYRGFFQQFSSNQAINAGRMVYSGPFQVRRWVSNNSIELVRNPNFTAIVPQGGADKYVQRVVYRIIQNTNSLLVAILGGGIDATSTVGITADQARSRQLTSRAPGRFDIWAVPGPIWEHIDINKFTNVQRVRDLTLDDRRTRQALLHAINREAWVQAFFDGTEPVSHTWVSPYNPLFNPNVRKYEYNPARARELLAQVGWRPGPDGILQRTVDGRTVRFELEFVTTAGNAVRERTQQLFIEQWRQVGIAVRTANAPSAVVFADDFIQRGEEGKWLFFMFAWVSSLAEDGRLFQYRNLNTGAIQVPSRENNYAGQNIGNWRNEEFDRLTSQAVLEFDEARRKQLFARAQEIWAEELPALPLRFRSNYLIVRNGLVNYVASTYSGGNGYPGWNAWEIGWASRGAVKRHDQAQAGGIAIK
ncbi:MAG: peptide ABC transporter substrate-binding protein [Meiothermus sp.]|uniref:peptide ABC transporter substrate-binding protein n=1 Tax=Meiothermus sp. TaxID=1955249 RepID=UPI0025E79475|nr:peptide ABC transporter substrate-binding protein [Meiothermus sp.]MCS7058359.1 peptide ABC transporter substrate-binding protein [Meiothermus sp.]MCS7194940.1 peptide ABC transporter substrate-binding protein [Meiothermus sp.]MCX7740689.1 peptide ABC transporter substrate-binding protein [Meiothermus sp.]MDW8090664.1 peptide ABC transporter substrate-binding protein [Meiothermus sp.]MDW8482580.1 peptide ABC transporter substrate-binding protein [Meiothermus sp.]